MPLKSTLSKIAHSLSDEKKLAYLPPIVWEPTTLSHGYPGLIIAFSLMHQHFPDEGWDTVSRKYASLLLHEIAANGIKDASLFSGLAGIVWALRHVQAMPQLEALLVAKAEEVKEPDVISGLCGVARVLEQRDTIKRHLTKLIGYNWYQPNHFLLPQGGYDTGLAHGLTGALLVLAHYQLENISVQGQLESIKTLAYWLVDRATADKKWPSVIGSNSATTYYRDGWCYGAPGVAYALIVASKALGDKSLEEFAQDALYALCVRCKAKTTNLECLSVCHGFSGILSLLAECKSYVACPFIDETIGDLVECIAHSFNETKKFGFCCHVNLPDAQQPQYLDSPGLLNGTAGILISLLKTLSSTNRPYAFAIA